MSVMDKHSRASGRPDVRLRRYMPGDHLVIKLQDVQIANARTDHMIASQIKSGTTFTAIIDGRVRAVGGIVEFWPGRVLAWGFVDHRTPRRAWPQLAKLVRQVLDEHSGSDTRVECQVRADTSGLWAFAKRLGFKQESILVQFHAGNNYIMGVRSWQQ